MATVSLRLSVMTGFRGRFGPNKAVLGHKMRSFGRAPPDLAPPPLGATGEFLAWNSGLATSAPGQSWRGCAGVHGGRAAT